MHIRTHTHPFVFSWLSRSLQMRKRAGDDVRTMIQVIKYMSRSGHFLALAALHDTVLEVSLSMGILKYLMDAPLGLEDLAEDDEEMARQLHWLLENDVDDLNLTFTHCLEVNNKRQHVELKPHGGAITVTEENKHEYVSLVIETKMRKLSRAQHRAVKEGFFTCVPPNFSEAVLVHDLRKMLCGITSIDVDDWQAHSDLLGFSPDDEV